MPPLKFFIVSILILFSACKKELTKNCTDCGCPSTFTDSRDGITYKVVQIGDHCWMAENLKFVTANSWCYNDNDANCKIYGRLYNWQAAQESCPPGWHFPDEEEWNMLIDFLGGTDVAGGKMKSLQRWKAPNAGASNSSKFNALPGGYRTYDGRYAGLGSEAYWWSTAFSSSISWYRALSSDAASISNSYYDNFFGFSCRCIKD